MGQGGAQAPCQSTPVRGRVALVSIYFLTQSRGASSLVNYYRPLNVFDSTIQLSNRSCEFLPRERRS